MLSSRDVDCCLPSKLGNNDGSEAADSEVSTACEADGRKGGWGEGELPMEGAASGEPAGRLPVTRAERRAILCSRGSAKRSPMPALDPISEGAPNSSSGGISSEIELSTLVENPSAMDNKEDSVEDPFRNSKTSSSTTASDTFRSSNRELYDRFSRLSVVSDIDVFDFPLEKRRKCQFAAVLVTVLVLTGTVMLLGILTQQSTQFFKARPVDIVVGCWFLIAGATVINTITTRHLSRVSRCQLALNFYIPCALALCTMVSIEQLGLKELPYKLVVQELSAPSKSCVTVNQLLAEPNYEDAGRTISHYCTYRNPGDYLASSDGRDIRIAANLVEKLAGTFLQFVRTFGIPTERDPDSLEMWHQLNEPECVELVQQFSCSALLPRCNQQCELRKFGGVVNASHNYRPCPHICAAVERRCPHFVYRLPHRIQDIVIEYGTYLEASATSVGDLVAMVNSIRSCADINTTDSSPVTTNISVVAEQCAAFAAEGTPSAEASCVSASRVRNASDTADQRHMVSVPDPLNPDYVAWQVGRVTAALIPSLFTICIVIHQLFRWVHDDRVILHTKAIRRIACVSQEGAYLYVCCFLGLVTAYALIWKMWHLDGSYNRPAWRYLYAASAALCIAGFWVSLLALIVMIGTKPSSTEKARVSELMAAKRRAKRLSRARKGITKVMCFHVSARRRWYQWYRALNYGGSLYPVRLVVTEIGEIAIQIAALSSNIHTVRAEGALVLLTLVSVNLVLVALAWRKLPGDRTIRNVILLDAAIDKIYIFVNISFVYANGSTKSDAGGLSVLLQVMAILCPSLLSTRKLGNISRRLVIKHLKDARRKSEFKVSRYTTNPWSIGTADQLDSAMSQQHRQLDRAAVAHRLNPADKNTGHEMPAAAAQRGDASDDSWSVVENGERVSQTSIVRATGSLFIGTYPLLDGLDDKSIPATKQAAEQGLRNSSVYQFLFRLKMYGSRYQVPTRLLIAAVGIGCTIASIARYFLTLQACSRSVGTLAYCMEPKLFFRRGIVAPMECAFDGVEKLACAGRGISKLDSPELGPFGPLLEAADFSENPTLTFLPPTIANLTNLTTLDLSNTNIQPQGLPLRMLNMTQIKTFKIDGAPVQTHLDWSSLGLRSVPSCVGSPCVVNDVLLASVSWLDLSHNLYTKVPDAVCDFSQLQRLDLSHNHIPFLSTSPRCPLDRRVKFKSIDLSDNPISRISTEFWLSMDKTGKKIVARNGNVTQVLASVLNAVEVRRFLEWLRSGVLRNNTLEYFMLSLSYIDNEFWDALMPLSHGIKELIIERTFATPDSEPVLSKLTSLEKLSLTALRGGAFPLMVDQLSTLSSLRYLSLYQSDEGDSVLLQLPTLTRLTFLEISEANMTRPNWYEYVVPLRNLRALGIGGASSQTLPVPSSFPTHFPAMLCFSLVPRLRANVGSWVNSMCASIAPPWPYSGNKCDRLANAAAQLGLGLPETLKVCENMYGCQHYHGWADMTSCVIG